MFNHMIGNIPVTKIRLRSYICASSDVFLPSISSLRVRVEVRVCVRVSESVRVTGSVRC